MFKSGVAFRIMSASPCVSCHLTHRRPAYVNLQGSFWALALPAALDRCSACSQHLPKILSANISSGLCVACATKLSRTLTNGSIGF
jgi:hypothetical protein